MCLCVSHEAKLLGGRLGSRSILDRSVFSHGVGAHVEHLSEFIGAKKKEEEKYEKYCS
jgi:hypothetical protein